MNDHDLITLFHTSVELSNQTLMDYISVLFAFLVAGYFIADKLKLPMIILLIILFTVIEIRLITNMYFLSNDMDILSAKMAILVENGDFGLPGLVMATPGDNYFLSQVIVTIGSYIGALIFFFHQRSVGLAKNSIPKKAEN